MVVGGWDGLKKNANGTYEKGGRSGIHRKRIETIAVFHFDCHFKW